MEITTRKEAKARGLKRYFTGKPCKHGHIAEREGIAGNCIPCNRLDTKNRAAKQQALNPEKTWAYKRKWRAEHPEQYRAQKRKQAHKKLPAPTRARPEYCEACGQPPSGRLTVLCLDHDHATDTFRGWLCSGCNVALGLLGDSPERAAALAAYVRRVSRGHS